MAKSHQLALTFVNCVIFVYINGIFAGKLKTKTLSWLQLITMPPTISY